MKCDSCQREMKDHVGCTLQVYSDTLDIPRVPYSEEETQDCHDCLVPPGALHHPGCDMERCGKCHGQLITCSCIEEMDDATSAESPS